MKCNNCKKTIELGSEHRITGIKNYYFCSDECAEKWLKNKKDNNCINFNYECGKNYSVYKDKKGYHLFDGNNRS